MIFKKNFPFCVCGAFPLFLKDIMLQLAGQRGQRSLMLALTRTDIDFEWKQE